MAICTWNRAKLLDQTLTTMQNLRIPAGVEWELLVVNNRCTDDTDTFIAWHQKMLPLRRLYEPEPGLSNARNSAVANAMGDYILWTDDDVLVSPKWLVEYVKAFRDWPDAASFGGPAEPWSEGTLPRWLVEFWTRVHSAYAMRDFGDCLMQFNPTCIPFGLNLALRIDVQRCHPFPADLGNRPGSMLGHEETTVLQQLLAEGLEGGYVPQAKVRHYIPKNRQTLRHLHQFYFGQGEIEGRSYEDAGDAKISGKPRWLVRKAIEASFRFLFMRVFCRPKSYIQAFIQMSTSWGSLYGVRAKKGPMIPLMTPVTMSRTGQKMA